jgi:hypothetical protein
MAENDDATSGRAPVKRKTTYPRDHPTENPKPPKRTKAEIQQAAKAKREAEQAKKAIAEAEKKKKILDAEKKRKLSAQRIAAVEDALQCSQKQLQSHSERPDLKTMETYKEQIRRQEIDSEPELITNQDDLEGEPDDMYVDTDSDGIRLGFPPESALDTDSDGIHLGLSEDEGDDMDEDYNNEEDAIEEDLESASDDAETYRDLKKQDKKKKKVRIGSFRVVLGG